MLVSGAADKKVKLWDISAGLSNLGEMTATDAVFSGDIADNVFIAGCGDGNVVAFNLDTMETIWGYGVEP